MSAPHRPLLLLRADGGPGIGNGHVSRSLSLAETWISRGGRAVLAAATLSDQLRDRARTGGVPIQELRDPIDVDELRLHMTALKPAWVVLDGYRFHRPYQAAAADAARVLVIDDHGSLGSYRADIVLDQNLGARSTAYAASSPHCTLLLGPRFALLQEQLRALAQRKPGVPATTVERLLVTLGGAPPPEAKAAVAEAVRLAGAVGQATFVDGNKSPREMVELMAAADLALSAAGSTAWELAALGVPMLLVPIADNQDQVAAVLAAQGMAASVPRGAPPDEIAAAVRHLIDDHALRSRLAAAGRGLVDGNGSRRVVTAMKGRLLELRDAEPDDAHLLWRWANDPAVRESAFRSEAIPWPSHQAWFAQRLASLDCRILIARHGDDDIGQIRFERDPETGDAEVDVSVAVERRGEGWAPALIERASADILASGWSEALHARVKVHNRSSQSAFLEAGFELVDEAVPGPLGALHYARRERHDD